MDGSEEPRPDLSPRERRERAASFGRAASHYARYRPGPPPDAVTWLLPAPVEVVVDVGAGTGALTRLLTGRADRVLAVEPDEDMRSVLAEGLPDVTVLDGRAESLPLADGTADLVVASSSWHWVEVDPALREARRVLRPDGALAALWTGPDPDATFMAEALRLLGGVASDQPASRLAAETARAASADGTPLRTVLAIPDGHPFSEPDHQVFRFDLALTADDLVGLLGTLSWVILLDPDERDALVATARRLLADGLGIEGDTTAAVTFRCDVFRSELLA